MLAWIDGHPDVSDALLLLAAVLFVLAAVGRWTTAGTGRVALPFVEVGLALVAAGLLVT